MNRRELVYAVCKRLRDLGVRKPIRTEKHTFHISDDQGTTKDFVIEGRDKSEIFTLVDVDNMLSATIDIIKKSLENNDIVKIRGFGSFGSKIRKGRSIHHPVSGEMIEYCDRPVVAFHASKEFLDDGNPPNFTDSTNPAYQETDINSVAKMVIIPPSFAKDKLGLLKDCPDILSLDELLKIL